MPDSTPDRWTCPACRGFGHHWLGCKQPPVKADREHAGLGRALQEIVAERDRLRAENEALSRDYGTLDRLVQDIERYALTPEPVLRLIEQARRAIADRAAVETDEHHACPSSGEPCPCLPGSTSEAYCRAQVALAEERREPGASPSRRPGSHPTPEEDR